MRLGLDRIEALLAALGRPEAGAPRRPHRRDQREGLRRRADGGDPPGRGAPDGSLYLAPSARGDGAHPDRRRAPIPEEVLGPPRRADRARARGRRRDVLRGLTAVALARLRGGRGRGRRARGGARRALGRDQRGAPAGVGGDPDRLRPPGVPRPGPRGHRGREGRNHPGRHGALGGAGARGHGGHRGPLPGRRGAAPRGGTRAPWSRRARATSRVTGCGSGGRGGRYDDVRLALPGLFQPANAVLAVGAVRVFAEASGLPVTEAAVRAGCARGQVAGTLPGRPRRCRPADARPRRGAQSRRRHRAGRLAPPPLRRAAPRAGARHLGGQGPGGDPEGAGARWRPGSIWLPRTIRGPRRRRSWSMRCRRSRRTSCSPRALARRSSGRSLSPGSTWSASRARSSSWRTPSGGSAPVASSTPSDLVGDGTGRGPARVRDGVPRRHRVLARPGADRLRAFLPEVGDVGRGPAPLVCPLLRLRRGQLELLCACPRRGTRCSGRTGRRRASCSTSRPTAS